MTKKPTPPSAGHQRKTCGGGPSCQLRRQARRDLFNRFQPNFLLNRAEASAPISRDEADKQSDESGSNRENSQASEPTNRAGPREPIRAMAQPTARAGPPPIPRSSDRKP